MITRDIRIKYIYFFLIIYVIWISAYMFIGYYVSDKPFHSLSIPLDEKIPFIPGFISVYLLCYIVPVVPLFIIRESQKMDRLIMEFIILNFFAFIVFILFPVYCPRAEFKTDSIPTFLLSAAYRIDRPFNNFPSLHVGISWLIYLACRRYSPVLNILLFLSTAGIGIATLFIKQHYIVDVAAGLAASTVVYVIFEKVLLPYSFLDFLQKYSNTEICGEVEDKKYE